MKKRFDNLITLQGITSWYAEFREKINDTINYRHYYQELEVRRKSGVVDTIPLVIPESIVLPEVLKKSEIAVLCWGTLQTVRNPNTGKVSVFVLVEHIEPIKGDKWKYENEIVITGEIGRVKRYKVTSVQKKRICEVRLITRDSLKGQLNKSFIPCVFFDKLATAIMFDASILEGQTIKINGRLQSRQYTKMIDGTEVIFRVNEVAVDKFDTYKSEDYGCK